MKYLFSTDNHAYAYSAALLKGFGLANLTDIATHIARTSYFCHWDGPGTSYVYFAGIASVIYCIMIVFCIFTILRAIYKGK